MGGPDVALLRRRRAKPAENPIGVLWQWWTAEGRALAEQCIDGRLEVKEFARTMAAHVHPIGGLSWELTAGETSQHVLVLRSEGDPSLRALARRVVLAAPDADETWSFVDSRPPAPDPEAVVLGAGSGDIDFARVQVAARMSEGRFDVEVHHPAFADLPQEGRMQITLLALDAALGEIDSELWLGEIRPAEVAPLDGFGLTALRSVVADLKGRRLDRDGQPGWVMLRGETSEGPLMVMARSPLHALTAPHLDTYVAVALPYSHRTVDGMPGEGSLEPLRDFEERLESRLGTSGQVVAHLSNAGTRTLHVYVDSTAGLLPTVKDVARSWDQGKASVHDMYDPGWSAVGHLHS